MNTTIDRGPSNNTVYAIIGLMVAFMLLAAGAYLFLSGGQPAGLTVGGPFSLIDGDGHPVTDQTWRGKYMLVYFGTRIARMFARRHSPPSPTRWTKWARRRTGSNLCSSPSIRSAIRPRW